MPVAEALKSRPQDPRSVERGCAIDVEFLFENIVSDLHWSAFHSATICTMLDACVREKAVWTLRSWRHIMDDNRKIMKLALRYCAEIGLSAEIETRISDLYDQISEAKASIGPLMNSAKNYSSAEFQLAAQNAVKWRQLCHEAAPIVVAMEPLVKRRLPKSYLEDSSMLVRYLKEAANFETARVDVWGEISLPPLNQRRQYPRVAIRTPCRLVWSSTTVDAELRDASRTGLAVECKHALEKGQELSVEIQDGNFARGCRLSERRTRRPRARKTARRRRSPVQPPDMTSCSAAGPGRDKMPVPCGKPSYGNALAEICVQLGPNFDLVDE